MAAVFDNLAIEKVAVVVSQVADLVQKHLFHAGSECDFQGAMPVTKGTTEDGRLTVVDAVALTELIVGHCALPVLADGGRSLGAGWMLVHTDKDLIEEVIVFEQSLPRRVQR